MKRRLNFLSLTFIVLFVGLLARLAFWQVLKGSELSSAARLQYRSREKISASRGNILASDGTWLAAAQVGWTIFGSRPEIRESAKSVANKLAPFFVKEDNKKEVLTEIDRLEILLNKKDIVWVPLRRKMKTEVKKNIEALQIKGIGFEPEEMRYYPEASKSAHLLGFVGKNEKGEDRGYFGLEGYYDLTLKGKPGFLEDERDPRGVPILVGDSREISAISGIDILTHIDKTVQILVEQKLQEGIEKYGAVSGSVVVMNPSSGAVLAMASFPSYDPEKYYDFENELFKNPVISNSFEPGSIFKPIVMAIGLDAGVILPDTICDICDGPVSVDKYLIETWDKKYRENQTMTDVIVHSDNVGMTFVGQKIGKEALFDYFVKFGFGEKTGIDLQGEASPAIREKDKWNIVDLATATFGQGIAVTPIQMITAVSVIANGGNRVKPQVVAKLLKDDWSLTIKPEIGPRVLSAKTTRDIKNMMVAAVKNGEAKWTAAKGFRIAGKTGTAQIPVSGHYDEEKTIASFVGFAPADNPKFIMLVTLREPTTSPWGSETAAPLWFSIARELFSYLSIRPEE